MNNPKRTITVLATLLALSVGWIFFKQIEEARTVASKRELTEDARRGQAEIEARRTAQPQPVCPPCPACSGTH